MIECCKKIEERCRLNGIKLTPHRMLIVQIMCEANDHPDAEEIYDRASKRDPKISLATIYRSLFLFEQHGVIHKLAIGDGKARYEIKDHIHHHLLDLQDSKIVEFENHELNDLLIKIAYNLGYRIIHCKVELKALPIDKK